MADSEFTAEIRAGYLLIRCSPGYVFDRASNERLWAAIGEHRDQTGVNAVLIVGGGVERRMTTEDALESALAGARLAPGIAMAVCLDGYQPDSLTEFFINAARNRGVKVQFFGDLAEALHWLGVDETPANTSNELAALAAG